MISHLFSQAWNRWNHFWFESFAPEQMKLFRVIFGSLILVFNLIRAMDVTFLYSDQGILPQSVLSDVIELPFRLSWFSLVHTEWGTRILYGSFLVSLLLMTIGIWPRVFALIAFSFHVSLAHRNPGVTYGIDLITTFFLFYLALARFKLPEGKPHFFDQLGSVGFRFMQIQICIIYFYSGLEKLKGVDWWRGEAVWGMLANPIVARHDYSWMAEWPLLIIIPTYITLLWEIYFPVMVWNSKWRYAMLAGGVFMHFMIATLVSIPFFGFLMITSYAVFLKPEHARAVNASLPKWLNQS